MRAMILKRFVHKAADPVLVDKARAKAGAEGVAFAYNEKIGFPSGDDQVWEPGDVCNAHAARYAVTLGKARRYNARERLGDVQIMVAGSGNLGVRGKAPAFALKRAQEAQEGDS